MPFALNAMEKLQHVTEKTTFQQGEKRGKKDEVVGGGKTRWNLKIEAGLFQAEMFAKSRKQPSVAEQSGTHL